MDVPTRRHFLAGLAATASAALLSPVKAVAAATKPVRISEIRLFPIRIPIPKQEEEAGKIASYIIARVDTDVGVRGYSFAGPNLKLLDSAIRPALLGKDLFAMEQHLMAGLDRWDGFEHALWDAIGKIAGQPVSRLLGGERKSLKLYLTTVWRGNPDQSHVSYDEQAEMAVKFKNAGFKGIKIRAWRPNPLDDVEACRVIRAAVGPDFAIRFDRTAHRPTEVGQKVWDYETALRVARGLEKHNAYWLEEPLGRDDFAGCARLAREVDIPITGGEEFLGLAPFREALVNRSYDILNPESRRSGGIFMCCKIAWMAQAFHVPCVLHGTMGLRLHGCLHANAAIGSEWQELVYVTPPLLPEDLWNPALKILKSKSVFEVQDGAIQVPQGPGLGLDIDEEALERYRV